MLVAAILGVGLHQTASAVTFVAPEQGSFTAYYLGGNAGFKIELGLSVNGGPVSSFGLFNHDSDFGSKFDLGSVHAGDSLDFVLRVDGGDGNIYFLHSVDALNPVPNAQAVTSPFEGSIAIPPGIRFAFDDTIGQQNYTDYIFSVTETPSQAVPEPATWAMMVGGFALAGGALRRARGAIVTMA
jgi:hypothetical protein